MTNPQNSTHAPILRAFSESVELKAPQPGGAGGAPPRRQKGDITTFSRSARRNLIRKMMRVERHEISVPIFVTLTYHERYPSQNAPLKKELGRFLQAIRRLPATFHYLWRIEWQKRGAPHFHLLLWHDDPEYEWDVQAFKGWSLRTWHRVCSSRSAAHARKGAHVELCNTWSKAMSYVCKYLGKSDVPDDIEFRGRHWGASNSLPLDAQLEVEISLEEFYVLRRLIRKWLAKKGEGGRRYARVLRNGNSLHVNLPFATVIRLLDYIRDRDDLPDPVPREPLPPPEPGDPSFALKCLALSIWHADQAGSTLKWKRPGRERLHRIWRQVQRCSGASSRTGPA